MVLLHVKKGEESQFLFETAVSSSVDEVITEITIIYNGRLKISRICSEMEELAQHGTMLPPNMMGLTDEQVEELKLTDEWADQCTPSGGWTFNRDEVGRRNGRQPKENMQEVLNKTIEEAKAIVSKKQVQAGVPVTRKMVQEAIDMLRGAVTIVYPMGLPPHDTIRNEFENTEDLSGTQASLEVIDFAMATLWFSGKELQRGKKLSDFMGRNEKTRAVVKLQKLGQGAPGREPVMCEADQKAWMLHAYRKQEELKVGMVGSEIYNDNAQHRSVFDVKTRGGDDARISLASSIDANNSESVDRLFSSIKPDVLSIGRPTLSDVPLTAVTNAIASSEYSSFHIFKH